MECKNAYRKDGISYILCRCAGEPDAKDQRAVCHALCGFQRFCPNARTCTLLPTWPGCMRLKAPERPQEAAESEREPETGENAPKKSTRRKSATKGDA